MQNSCSNWQGHKAMPEILEFTQEKWVDSVVQKIFAELH